MRMGNQVKVIAKLKLSQTFAKILLSLVLVVSSTFEFFFGSVPLKDFGPHPPPPLNSVQNSNYVQNSVERLG